MQRISRIAATGVLLGLALAGCKKPAPIAESTASAPAPAAATEVASKQAIGPAASSPVPSAASMLAYAYAYGLQVPAPAVRPLMSRDEQACFSAGPTLCQVVSAEAASGRDDAEATLKLRAAEPWLWRFRAGLESEAKAAGGRVQRSEIKTEDLTRSIVDTGAAIRAKTVLRDRLEKLLAERPGKLSDLLDLEQNIASVQGEIDATQSELTVMQGRVAMSDLTIDYEPAPAIISARTLEPLQQAARGFLGNALGATAVLVTIVSYLLPFGILIGAAWLARGWSLRRRRARVS